MIFIQFTNIQFIDKVEVKFYYMKDKENTKSRIGNNLKKYRLESGLSQEDLAIKANVTFHTISKIETGATSDPRALTLEKLVKVLGIKIDDLLK